MSPKNPNRDYKKEGEWQAQPIQKKRRAQRNAARKKAMDAGKVTKGDNLEVHHPTAKRTGNLPDKTEVTSFKKNRSIQPKRGS